MNGRIAVALGVLALAAGVGCGGSSPAPTTTMTPPAATATFKNAYLEFRYPQSWRPLTFQIPPTVLHFNPMLYLSTQPGHDPCKQSGSVTSCSWPVDHLDSNGVLVVWENQGYPGWTLSTQSGKSLNVGGRPAKQVVSRPGDCGKIGADETVSVQIARPQVASNLTSFTACLRGPNLSDQEKEITALLASTRFLQP
jgi:hypothetical protein